MGVNVDRQQPAKLLTYLHDDTYKLIKLYLNKASTNYTYFYDCIRAASRQFCQLFPRHANSRPRVLLLSRDRIAETIKTNLTPFNSSEDISRYCRLDLREEHADFYGVLRNSVAVSLWHAGKVWKTNKHQINIV